MCTYTLQIYTTCGHSTYSLRPLALCTQASIPLHGPYSTTCAHTSHPYRSWKIDSLCPPCGARRAELMRRIDGMQKVQYDEWRWKVSYGMPAYGKDYWGRKAEEREKLEREGKKDSGGEGSLRRRKRFSWRWSKGRSP